MILLCFNRKFSDAGGMIFPAVLMTALVGLALITHLVLVRAQHQATVRSQAWNAAMPVAEAGVEEAFAHLNVRGATNLASDGWLLTNGTYYRSRRLGDAYYDVTISASASPIIAARGFVPFPFAPDGHLSRGVRVTTQSRGEFPYSFAASSKIDLSGATVIDSFDSCDPLHSVNGRYDPTRRKANAHVGTTATGGSGILKVNTCKIYGQVATGPGSTISVTSGSVGQMDWIDGGSSGIQPGSARDDLNVSFEPVADPFTGGHFAPASGTVDGTNYAYVLESGNYQLGSLLMSGSDAVVVTGNAVLKVLGKIDFTGECHIRIKPGASLKLYMAGGDAKLSGRGVINETGLAQNFAYFGLPNNKKLEFSGAGVPVEFIGTVYAPNAVFKMAGETTLTGAAVVRELHVSGDGYLHYDEALGSGEAGGGSFVITSWHEL